MRPFQIGVCSWSLKQPDVPAALTAARDELGLRLVQIGVFGPGSIPKDAQAIREAVARTGVEISATCAGFPGESYASIARIAETGGYGPAEQFEERLDHTRRMAELTAALGVRMMTTHIGFVPHDPATPEFSAMVDRLKRVCEVMAAHDLILTMETGQEPAEVLREFIGRVGFENIRVNFDPANMITYGAGDPIAAVGVLGDQIAHVHCKDGVRSAQPGVEWGREVPLGEGEVDFPAFITKLREIGYAGPLVIEREGGPTRFQDCRKAIELLSRLGAEAAPA